MLTSSFYRSIGCGHMNCPLSVPAIKNEAMGVSPFCGENPLAAQLLLLLTMTESVEYVSCFLNQALHNVGLPHLVYTCLVWSIPHISQLNTEGPLLIMGDLNAHLGCRSEKCATQDRNQKGSMWNSVILEHNLHSVSLGSLVSSPSYTYSSGEYFSTIDFVLANLDALRGIFSCVTRRSSTEHIWSPTSKLFCGSFSPEYEISPAFPTQPLDWKIGAKYFHTINLQMPVTTLPVLL